MKPNSTTWLEKFGEAWPYRAEKPLKMPAQAQKLVAGIKLIAKVRRTPTKPHRDAILEHPFDDVLLYTSPLYRKSRKLFLNSGGSFKPTLASAGRSLSSPILLSNVIEFTPLAQEFFWTAQDPLESREPEKLLRLRQFISSIFHEQNHRILWKHLPAPGSSGSAAFRRYCAFVESLVIALDMALADQLPAQFAYFVHLCGVSYDPGTRVHASLPNQNAKRAYRNYLQAALHATYLNLEGFDHNSISEIITMLFPNCTELAQRAARRSMNLNRGFVAQTNLIWQKKHRKKAIEILQKGTSGKPLLLPTDPCDHRLQYIFAENWFELMGL